MILQIILWFIVVIKVNYTLSQFNMTSYKQMPALYNFEDYDACLGYQSRDIKNKTLYNEDDIYCMVFAEIQPNNSSDLWLEIENISSKHEYHYRHDRLYFGVCLKRCRQLFKNFTKFRVKELYGGKMPYNEITEYYSDVNNGIGDNSMYQYDHLVSSCLNYDFQQKYNLTLWTSIEYCENAQKPLKPDATDLTVNIIFACLGTLIIFSSLYDYRLKCNQPLSNQNNEFYKIKLQSNTHKLLTAFSLCRNYYRLILPASGPYAEDLKFINAYRVSCMTLVIFAHVPTLFFAIQIENPEFLEKALYSMETSIIKYGTTIVQTFFVMSGFLLCIQFKEHNFIKEKASIGGYIRVYFEIFFLRYLRMAPSLLIFILFNASVLQRMQDGPFWRHFSLPERVFCREYWWKSLLFINNFLFKKSCSHQTWYIASDMQLFELFLIILIIIAKWPKQRNLIYSLLLLLSIGIPAFITYFLKLDAIYQMQPESYRYLFFHNVETFYKTYIPFYTNIGGYLFGVWSADIYLKFRSKELNLQESLKLQLGWWLIIPVFFGLLMVAILLMGQNFEKPSIWIALFAGLYKNVWAFICSIALLGMCFKLGWFAYEFTSSSFFRPLARISFQSYLWHVPVLRVLGGYFRAPIYVNRLFMTSIFIAALFLTILVSFLLALLVEYPFAELVKLLRKKYQIGTKKNKNKENISLEEINK